MDSYFLMKTSYAAMENRPYHAGDLLVGCYLNKQSRPMASRWYQGLIDDAFR